MFGGNYFFGQLRYYTPYSWFYRESAFFSFVVSAVYATVLEAMLC